MFFPVAPNLHSWLEPILGAPPGRTSRWEDPRDGCLCFAIDFVGEVVRRFGDVTFIRKKSFELDKSKIKTGMKIKTNSQSYL
jgi:hypothetical protein